MADKLFRVIFSGTARRRLQEISDYHTQTASSVVSRKIRRGILDEAGKLERLPGSKPILPDPVDPAGIFKRP